MLYRKDNFEAEQVRWDSFTQFNIPFLNLVSLSLFSNSNLLLKKKLFQDTPMHQIGIFLISILNIVSILNIKQRGRLPGFSQLQSRQRIKMTFMLLFFSMAFQYERRQR